MPEGTDGGNDIRPGAAESIIGSGDERKAGEAEENIR